MEFMEKFGEYMESDSLKLGKKLITFIYKNPSLIPHIFNVIFDCLEAVPNFEKFGNDIVEAKQIKSKKYQDLFLVTLDIYTIEGEHFKVVYESTTKDAFHVSDSKI